MPPSHEPSYDYAALCASATTVNQLDAVHTDLERRLTPLERAALVRSWGRRNSWEVWSTTWFARSAVEAVAKRVRPGWATSSRAIRTNVVMLDARSKVALQRASITGLQKAIRAAPSSRPAPFRRVLENDVLQLFQLSDEPSSTVLVAFTGKARRVMMALPDFLQHSQALGVDVALVSVPEQGATYWDGIPGYSDDLESLLARLSKDLSGYPLTESGVIGTSLGSIPAVIAGLHWRAKKVVAVGTFRPPADWWLGPLRPILDGESHPDLTSGATAFLFVYGQHSPLDTTVAHDLAALLGGEAEMVERAGHNPLHPLKQRGQLGAWLLRVFGEKP